MSSLATKKTSLRQKFILLAISIAIGLSLSEYTIRKLKLAPEVIYQIGNIRFVDNPRMVYEYVPGSRIFGSIINRQGFYDSDFTLEKPKNLIRIAMLGDSITLGVFVPLGKTFSDDLEKLLNQGSQKISSPLRYEVMNFGVGGYNLEAEVEVLKEKVLPYKPDIVVLNLFYNDNEPIPGVNFLFVENSYKLTEQQQILLIKKYVYNRNSPFRWFERNVLYKSKLYLFVVYRLSSLRLDREKLSKVRRIDGSNLKNMECVYRCFREIDKLKQQYGFKFLICIHPHLLYYEVPNNLKFAYIAGEFNFDYFHMVNYYKKENISPMALQLKDPPNDICHPNEYGHSLIAKAMLLELKKHNFIDAGL